MSRPAINFLLDCALLLVFLLVLLTAAILQSVFPAATLAAGWTLWGRDYDAWNRIHFACVVAMTLLIGLHLILHWTWVIGFVTSRLSTRLNRRVTTNESTRTLYGVCTLMAMLTLIGAALATASLAVRRPADTPVAAPDRISAAR